LGSISIKFTFGCELVLPLVETWQHWFGPMAHKVFHCIGLLGGKFGYISFNPKSKLARYFGSFS